MFFRFWASAPALILNNMTDEEKKSCDAAIAELRRFVPTVMVIGGNKDGNGFLFMGVKPGSPFNTQVEYLTMSIASVIKNNDQARLILMAAVSMFLESNFEYRKLMINALKHMQQIKR